MVVINLSTDDIPWQRIVHYYDRATNVPRWIEQLNSNEHAEAEKQLRLNLEHQDGVIQATPFAAYFMARALNAGKVRDPSAVRSILNLFRKSARFHLSMCDESVDAPDCRTLLNENQLWPASTSDDEIRWEEWNPGEQFGAWAKWTDIIISELVPDL